MKFFKCNVCGNVVAYLCESGAKVVCCGQEMQEIIPNTVDAAKEKHVPVYHVDGNKINVHVGSIDHPMEDKHYIEWIALETENGNQRKILKPNDKPEAIFSLVDGDKVKNVYAYCNLHGLWKA